MKALLVSFSGRKNPGNCIKTLEFVADVLENKYVETSFMRILDYDIKPCFDCLYECFDPEEICPVSDDVEDIYRVIADQDMIFLSLPVYSGAPCSKYFAFRERSQSIFHDSKLFENFDNVIKNYIVIGNQEAGGKQAVEFITSEMKTKDNYILLQSHDYDQSSISGRLIVNQEVKKRLKKFTLSALKNARKGYSDELNF